MTDRQIISNKLNVLDELILDIDNVWKTVNSEKSHLEGLGHNFSLLIDEIEQNLTEAENLGHETSDLREWKNQSWIKGQSTLDLI